MSWLRERFSGGVRFLNSENITAQGMRYLLVGGWNTFFGPFVYAVLFALWGDKVHYLILTIPANIIAVTNAYACYKIFVFKTKGNIIREYFKCYLVYGTSMLLVMAGMFILKRFFNIHPVAANILLTGVTVVISFFGHRHFSFRKKNDKCCERQASRPDNS